MKVKRPLILLVEDNADDVDLTLRAFRKCAMDCEVMVAPDGVEALHVLGVGSAPGEQPDVVWPSLVLLDLKMRRLDGLQCLRQLKADPYARTLPVVILTSSEEPQDRSDGYRLGANSYIRKPVDFIEFVDVVRQLGQYWLEINEAPPERRR